MNQVFQWDMNDLQIFLLVLFRITGMVMLAPLFGGDTVPLKVRALISLVLAVIFFPLIDRTDLVVVPNLGFFVVSISIELAIGMVIGFAAALLFVAAQFAGMLVDQELGLSLANVIDPISNQQVSVVGQFKMYLGMIVWLIISGHHLLIRATFESFQTVPVLGFSMPAAPGTFILEVMMRELFISAFRISAPAVVTLFMVTVTMAIMARVVPEMNIFILGFSLRLIIGFLVLLISLGIFIHTFIRIAETHGTHVHYLIKTMEPPKEGSTERSND